MAEFIQILLNSIIAGGLYSINAIGFNVIFGATKFLNVAHGVVAASAGYVVFFASRQHGINFGLSVVLGVLFAGLLGFAMDYFVYRPLRRRRASSLVQVIASLGLMIVVQAVIAMIFTSQFQTIGPEALSNVIFVGPGAITVVQLISVVGGVVILGGMLLLLHKTSFGRAVKAVSDDEEVARIIGINTDAIIGRVFFIGSMLAGCSGILLGIDTGLQPTMGFFIILEAATASIIGGLGSVPGAFLGAYLLAFVENFGLWKIDSEWKAAIAFGLLVLFLIFRPQGMFARAKN